MAARTPGTGAYVLASFLMSDSPVIMGNTRCLALVFPVAVQENSEGAGKKPGACSEWRK